MIEKLSLSDTRPGTIIDKVNELVDYVNALGIEAIDLNPPQSSEPEAQGQEAGTVEDAP